MAQVQQQPSPEALAALKVYNTKDLTEKVVILFKGTGSALPLKGNIYKVSAANTFRYIIWFLQTKLLKTTDPVFCYINQAFAPSPDDILGNLYQCFGSGQYLIINYSHTVAWG